MAAPSPCRAWTDRLRSGQGLLLDFDAHPALQALANRGNGRIGYVAVDAKERLGLGALLVRPDGVVAWAADDDLDPDLKPAAEAASRWFGEGDQEPTYAGGTV